MAPRRNFSAVLFDFDGVLACTLQDLFRAWAAAMRTVGAKIEKKEFYLLEGMPVRKIAATFCHAHGIAKKYLPHIISYKENHYRRHHHFKTYPGAAALLRKLHSKGVPVAVVTGAFTQRLYDTVPKKFLGKCRVIIAGDTLRRGKPYPDPYLSAARALCTDPKKCIAVENAPLGIQSAKTAGAYCIGVESTLSKNELIGADEWVKNIAALSRSKVFRTILA